MPASASSQGKNSNNAIGDVQFELIGQVTNPTATTSIQFGYLTYINDTVTERVVNNGSIRIINRVGTTTIYLDTTPDGDFANPDSFGDGVPVQTSVLRHQVIIDTVSETFTTLFVNTIISSGFFHFGDQNISLGKIGQKFRLTVFGHLNTPGPPAGHFAGYAAGPDLTRF